jgi:hypothetical protein
MYVCIRKFYENDHYDLITTETNFCKEKIIVAPTKIDSTRYRKPVGAFGLCLLMRKRTSAI